MDDYKQYLAQEILTGDKLVTYRLLSRALNVHVNTAKEMLYEFHKWQNDKRPGTLHATYLLYGTPKRPEETDVDVEMSDSVSESGLPFSDEVPSQALTLVAEEQLQDVLKQYEEVTSVHVYSLAPHPLKDLQLLVDTAQSVVQMTLKEQSSGPKKADVFIKNPGVRRRERKGGMPRPPAVTPAVKSEPKPSVKPEPKSLPKQESKPIQPAVAKDAKASVTASATTATAKKGGAAPALKRQGSSGGISHMFAKATAKPKKPASRASSTAAPVAAEEASPALSDEGEDDSEMPDVKPDPEAAMARKNRRAELHRMMEESDDEETASKPQSPAEEFEEDEEHPAPESEPAVEEGPSEVVASSGDGRKRGRRRVTKKKQIMDDQGYLVTIQEQGWESFSEEEAPAPPKPQIEKTGKSAPVPAPAAKAKKLAGKAQQGNIMSFFSKK